MEQVTVVGGGLAGLTAAISACEAGARATLIEAREALGGRARTDTGPYKANLGPHALYKGGPLWSWLEERGILPDYAGLPLAGVRFRASGAVRRTPPMGALPAVLRLRGRSAPVDRDFRGWVTSHSGSEVAEMLSGAAGVFTFHYDPGSLSAAFVWERSVRVLFTPPPVARYPLGGWQSLVAALERRARELGVEIALGEEVTTTPEPPVVVATELDTARELLDDDSLNWPSGHTVCIDLGLQRRRGDPFVVSDLDEAGWIERYTAADRSLAPAGQELVQAQMPVRPDEGEDLAAMRLERLLDLSLPDWRERATWRRRLIMKDRTGALDPPSTTWRDRPAVDRGGGIFLAGDRIAANGLLSEVAWSSGVQAGRMAAAAAGAPTPRAPTPHLPSV